MSQGYPEPGAHGGATPKTEDQFDAEMSQRAPSGDDASPELLATEMKQLNVSKTALISYNHVYSTFLENYN